MSREDKTREAIARVARGMRDHDNRNGGSMTYDQAKRLVSEARRDGDRIRDDNKR